MVQLTRLNYGTSANDNTGDGIRTTIKKIDDNFKVVENNLNQTYKVYYVINENAPLVLQSVAQGTATQLEFTSIQYSSEAGITLDNGSINIGNFKDYSVLDIQCETDFLDVTYFIRMLNTVNSEYEDITLNGYSMNTIKLLKDPQYNQIQFFAFGDGLAKINRLLIEIREY